ncbi:hypothetical protein J437_LFUL006942 [Ladona fulva]|uniref:Glutaredoxin domain-containing protein n=1 Tax=Ladona fulva TaxID=123851 RepID=A0A8K0P2T6_LADFU|nr:hypothetical protein J437_LFUL006942 [Ladona fulva]
MEGTVPQKVQSIISADKVVIFSKSRCAFCTEVKKLFEKKGQAVTAVELDKTPECFEMQDYLEELTGARTVPRVFIWGICYGGCNDLKNLDRSGKLDKILEQS